MHIVYIYTNRISFSLSLCYSSSLYFSLLLSVSVRLCKIFCKTAFTPQTHLHLKCAVAVAGITTTTVSMTRPLADLQCIYLMPQWSKIIFGIYEIKK